MKKSEMAFVERIEEYIDLDEIEDRNDLLKKLHSKRTAKTNRGYTRQLNILSEYLGLAKKRIDDSKGRPIHQTVGGRNYPVGEYYLIKDSKQEKHNVVIYTPKGFKKRQIRDINTGKVLGWIK